MLSGGAEELVKASFQITEDPNANRRRSDNSPEVKDRLYRDS